MYFTILSEKQKVMALCARAHRLLLRRQQERPSWRRMIYSFDGVFDSHLKEDTVRRVEAHWRPRLASTLPKVSSISGSVNKKTI
jgi:hypothetical protein